MSTISTALTTAEELMELPHGEGFRYELINGELEKTMSPGLPRGRITMRLAGPLSEFIWAHDLGDVFAAETGFQLTFDPDTVLAPDVSFVNKARLEQVGETERYCAGAPDLVVEVLSPSDRPSKVIRRPCSGLRTVRSRYGLQIPEAVRCGFTGRPQTRQPFQPLTTSKLQTFCRVSGFHSIGFLARQLRRNNEYTE